MKIEDVDVLIHVLKPGILMKLIMDKHTLTLTLTPTTHTQSHTPLQFLWLSPGHLDLWHIKPEVRVKWIVLCCLKTKACRTHTHTCMLTHRKEYTHPHTVCRFRTCLPLSAYSKPSSYGFTSTVWGKPLQTPAQQGPYATRTLFIYWISLIISLLPLYALFYILNKNIYYALIKEDPQQASILFHHTPSPTSLIDKTFDTLAAHDSDSYSTW